MRKRKIRRDIPSVQQTEAAPGTTPGAGESVTSDTRHYFAYQSFGPPEEIRVCYWVLLRNGVKRVLAIPGTYQTMEEAEEVADLLNECQVAVEKALALVEHTRQAANLGVWVMQQLGLMDLAKLRPLHERLQRIPPPTATEVLHAITRN